MSSPGSRGLETAGTSAHWAMVARRPGPTHRHQARHSRCCWHRHRSNVATCHGQAESSFWAWGLSNKHFFVLILINTDINSSDSSCCVGVYEVSRIPGIMPSDGMECFMDHVFVSQVMQRTRSIQWPCWEKTKLRLTPPGLCLQGLVSGCPYRHSLPGSGNRCPISSMTLLHKKMLGVSK